MLPFPTLDPHSRESESKNKSESRNETGSFDVLGVRVNAIQIPKSSKL